MQGCWLSPCANTAGLCSAAHDLAEPHLSFQVSESGVKSSLRTANSHRSSVKLWHSKVSVASLVPHQHLGALPAHPGVLQQVHPTPLLPQAPSHSETEP